MVGALAAVPACTPDALTRKDADGGEVGRVDSGGRVTELCLLVADSAAAHQRGLSSRESLDPFDGMLFVFDRKGPYRFWMKDTTIPLDLVPVGSDGVLGPPIAMPPCPGGAACPTYGPPEPYDRALELPQGLLASEGIDPAVSRAVFTRTGAVCPTR